MVKTFLLFIAGSALVLGMSIDPFFTALFHSISYINVDRTEVLINLMDLLILQTGVPANGYNFTNLTDLLYILEGADYIYEIGYTHVDGVWVHAINIGSRIYSVEPRIFHSLIYLISTYLV
jgi:hypothetical protein